MNLHETNMVYHIFWLIPLFIGITYLGIKRRNQRLNTSFEDEVERRSATREISYGKRRLRLVLAALVLILSVLALARPQWGNDELGISTSGGDVTIVLDVSRSMFARDIKPDRLTVAKNLIQELMAALPSHRFSLVVFAGKAYTACPMTSSRTSLKMILNDVSPTTMPYGGTNLEVALRESLNADEGAETNNRTIIIFSDGDLQQGSVDALVSDYRKAGVPVAAVGVGVLESNALIQLPDNNFVRFNGEPVRTSLDPSALKDVARQTGGTYWQADNEPLLPERLATALTEKQSASTSQSRVSRPTERHQWPVACALACLAVAVVISDKKAIATAAIIVVFALPLSSASAEEMSEAVVNAELALDSEASPARKVVRRYHLAVALQNEKENQRAVDHYKKVILSNFADGHLRVAAMKNLVAIYFSSGETALNDTPSDAMVYFQKVIVLCKAALEISYDADLVKSLEAAGDKLITAEKNYRRQEELKKLKADAVAALKKAADAQARSNKSTGSESQKEAKKLTEKAQTSTSKLKDEALDSLMEQAVKYQTAVLRAEDTGRAGAIREEAMDTLIKALEHLGVTYRKPKDDTQQNAPPPKELPKNQRFDEVKDKKKRAVMILREMRKEEENQRKEIRDAREKAFRARLGEERDW